MNLTERERAILCLARQGLSDYRIARKMSIDPPNVTRSRKNAQKKLVHAARDLDWASRMGVNAVSFNLVMTDDDAYRFSFFL